MGICEYQIQDMGIYLNGLQKSVVDKMFFVDKIFEPITTIVDFGCANGELIKALQLCFREYRYIGYDINEDMLCAAKANAPDAEYYAHWEDISVDVATSLLNISSTIHEVYSYSSEEEIALFWERVFHSGFQYIAIRDMMFSEQEKQYLNQDHLTLVRENITYRDKLRDYESLWGPIASQHDLLHYLLKYKYAQNWEREVRENYVPLTIEQLFSILPEEYEIAYMDHFTLPYIAWQIREDFQLDVCTPTHIKMILKRKSVTEEPNHG